MLLPAGKYHLRGLSASSVSDHPVRLTGSAPVLYSSIQSLSESGVSSSRSVSSSSSPAGAWGSRVPTKKRPVSVGRVSVRGVAPVVASVARPIKSELVRPLL